VGRIPNSGWSLAGDGRLPGNTSSSLRLVLLGFRQNFLVLTPSPHNLTYLKSSSQNTHLALSNWLVLSFIISTKSDSELKYILCKIDLCVRHRNILTSKPFVFDIRCRRHIIFYLSSFFYFPLACLALEVHIWLAQLWEVQF
jgi:hypothetical protein